MSNVNKHDLWPSENYIDQVEKLKNSINKKIYLIELRPNRANIAIHHTDDVYQLLAVIGFPKPDPEKGLFPHCVLLDDGRGINLGRIARISVDSAFSPSKEQILYEENKQLNRLTSHEHRATKDSIAATSKFLLGTMLNKQLEHPARSITHKSKLQIENIIDDQGVRYEYSNHT